jgi:hypothetical protein
MNSSAVQASQMVDEIPKKPVIELNNSFEKGLKKKVLRSTRTDDGSSSGQSPCNKFPAPYTSATTSGHVIID